VDYAAGFTRRGRLLFKDDHVARTGRLDLEEGVSAIDFHSAEHALIEVERPVEIFDGERYVSQAMSADHGSALYERSLLAWDE